MEASMFGADNERHRERWVKAQLATLPSGWRILDAGAGTQPFRQDCSHLRYVAQDFGQYDGAGNGAGLHVDGFRYGPLDHVCDICAIPEPDGAFDAILCTEVLEHLADPVLAIREFARLLRPGGRLILTAPFASLTHFAPHHYATGFNVYWYRKHLGDSGLDIETCTANGSWNSFVAQELLRLGWGTVPDLPRPGLLTRIASRIVRRFLHRHDSPRASELGCFGYHVVGVKR